GISFLLIDMKSPGVTVRPIQLIDGGHEVNEIFFDNVEVPVENLVGEENKGWTYAKFLLGNERTGIARIGASKVNLARAKAYAAVTKTARGTLLDDPLFSARLTRIETELTALEMTQLRILSTQAAGSDKPDPRSSVLKLKGSQLQEDISKFLSVWLGRRASASAPTRSRGRGCSIRRTVPSTAFPPTSTPARAPSTAVRTRSSAESSRRRCSVSEIPTLIRFIEEDNSWILNSTTFNRNSPAHCTNTCAASTTPPSARRSSAATRASHDRSGRPSPRWACWACPCPRATAVRT